MCLHLDLLPGMNPDLVPTLEVGQKIDRDLVAELDPLEWSRPSLALFLHQNLGPRRVLDPVSTTQKSG